MTNNNDPAIAYLEALAAHYDNPLHGSTPPTPPTPEVAAAVAAQIAQTLAAVLEWQKTGHVTLDPSPESTLAAAELIDRVSDRVSLTDLGLGRSEETP